MTQRAKMRTKETDAPYVQLYSWHEVASDLEHVFYRGVHRRRLMAWLRGLSSRNRPTAPRRDTRFKRAEFHRPDF